jgi:hypothetical protein
MDGLNRKRGPALIAMNGWPNSVKSTMSTEPADPLGESAGSGVTVSTWESGNKVA